MLADERVHALGKVVLDDHLAAADCRKEDAAQAELLAQTIGGQVSNLGGRGQRTKRVGELEQEGLALLARARRGLGALAVGDVVEQQSDPRRPGILDSGLPFERRADLWKAIVDRLFMLIERDLDRAIALVGRFQDGAIDTAVLMVGSFGAGGQVVHVALRHESLRSDKEEDWAIFPASAPKQIT